MSDRVVLLSIPQVRSGDVTPGALASLDHLARRGGLHELDLARPGTTAPAFASLVTGVAPTRHGIVGRGFFDRAAGRVIAPPLPDATNPTATGDTDD